MVVGVFGEHVVKPVARDFRKELVQIQLQLMEGLNVQDNQDNTTRFLVMEKRPKTLMRQQKKVITSILFQVRNIPAALYKAMGGFATNNVNMIKLESYMLGGSFEATQFFADIQGHPEDSSVRRALDELKYFTNKLDVIGVYKQSSFRDKYS